MMIGNVNQPPIGDLSALTTASKTSAVAAINELDVQVGAAARATLTTTVKSSVVGAINEINDLLAILYLEVASQMEWWQLPQRTCLAAYNPQQAASYAASLTNLSGGTAIIERAAPDWDGMRGWKFTGTQWLDIDIAPTEGYTMVVRVKGVAATRFVCGAWNATNSKGFCIAKDGLKRQYFSGGYVSRSNLLDFDVLGIAGPQPYANGAADGSALAAWGYAIAPTIAIGKLNGFTGNMLIGDVLQFAYYPHTLNAVEMALIYQRINAIRSGLAVFGDSITAGSGASDEAHRYANLLAAAWNRTLLNAGVGGTVLQNTDALADNGRDRYADDVSAYRPERIVIMYGLNDLRYNGVNFSVANYENDLGEVVAGLIADGATANNIMVCSPPYMKPSFFASYTPWNAGSTLKQEQYAAAASAIATAYDTRYCDVYAYMLANGGDTLVSADGVHPNDTGHDAIADAIIAAWS